MNLSMPADLVPPITPMIGAALIPLIEVSVVTKAASTPARYDPSCSWNSTEATLLPGTT